MLNLGISPLALTNYTSSGDDLALSIVLVRGLSPSIKISNPIELGKVNIGVIMPELFVTSGDADIDQYRNVVLNYVRYPIFKIERLRQDETPFDSISGYVVDNSGSISVENSEGVQRTSSFSITNIGGIHNEFVSNLAIGDKFRLYLGEEIDGSSFLISQGVFVFDNPQLSSSLSDTVVEISGTDKWSMLNGQHGGILEGTYIVSTGSTFGDMIRRTLSLDIVGDPIPPNIHPSLEEMEITYDITKSAGETISDVILDAAININATTYYDENGVFTAVPIDDDSYIGTSYIFNSSDMNYISGSNTQGLDGIYNSVLVVADNAQNSDIPITCEVKNEDESDPNSIPNRGYKKVFMVSDYLDGIDTDKKALERAKYELRKIKNKYSSVDIECLDILYLDIRQVVQIFDDSISVDGQRYIINAVSRNIGTDISVSLNLSVIKDK